MLEGKVAFVTGGSRGIGRGIAAALTRAGARVALSYCERRDAAEAVVSEIERAGGAAMCVRMRNEDRASIQSALADIAERWGPVEILVNNAAIAQEKPFDAITDGDWDRMLAINLRGPFACSQLVAGPMAAAGWGRIINITSIGGQCGGYNQVHYAASKAALISLTQSLARVYSGQGITANAIAVGLVATEMTDAELASPQGQQRVAGIPVGRVGTIEDVAASAVFLASQDASYISGQTLNVNGGMYFG